MKLRGFLPRSRIVTAAILAVGVTSVVVTSAADASPTSKTRSSTSPIVIATIVGTTGAYGATGVSIVRGASVAVAYLNAHGGILGRRVKSIAFNDNASSTLASQLFRRAVSQGAVVINGSSDTGPTTAALAARYKIPDVGIVDDGGPTIYANGPGTAPNPWAYEFSINNYAMGAIFAQYALKKCPGGKLALLHDSTSYGVGAAQAEAAVYAAHHKKLSVNDTITENWTTGATVGLTSEINKIKATGATCVDVWLTPQDSAAFLQQAKSLGDHFTVLGNDEYYATNTFLQLAGSNADGAITAEQRTALHPNKMTRKFDKLFHKKYPNLPAGYNTTYPQATWDAIMMVARAIKKAKSTKPSAIQYQLDHTKKFLGATGVLGFTTKNHQTITPKQLVLIKYNATKKKWVEVKW